MLRISDFTRDCLFQETNREVLHQLIRSHPLGTWVCNDNGELDINHIPFLLEVEAGGYGTLKGHVAKANPIWKMLASQTSSVVVFQGAQAYITPSWYASKQEHQKVVPTWNYAVVHAHGIAQAVNDQTWLLDHLNALTDAQEHEYTQPWKVSDAPDNFIERMLNGIIGIEIPISKLVGAWKTSQNKQQADKEGVINGLKSKDDSQSTLMASYITQHIES